MAYRFHCALGAFLAFAALGCGSDDTGGGSGGGSTTTSTTGGGSDATGGSGPGTGGGATTTSTGGGGPGTGGSGSGTGGADGTGGAGGATGTGGSGGGIGNCEEVYTRHLTLQTALGCADTAAAQKTFCEGIYTTNTCVTEWEAAQTCLAPKPQTDFHCDPAMSNALMPKATTCPTEVAAFANCL